MKKLILTAFAVVRLAAAFGAGYVTHRNDLVPNSWRKAAKRVVSNKFLDGLGATRATPADRGDMVPMRRDAGASRLAEKDTEALLASAMSRVNSHPPAALRASCVTIALAPMKD